MSEFFPPESVQSLLLIRLRSLNPHFNVSAYFNTFSKLKSNLDRVNYVYKDLKKYNLFPHAIKDGKNDSESKSIREEGNEAFGEGDYRTALQLYSMSLSTAKSAGVLALSYANRSAALYKLGRYEDCLVDIERALANNYPENLKPKLVTRRKHAEKLLNSSKPLERYHQDIPEIPPNYRHPTIQSAKNCVKIESNEEFGRHVVATRDIQIGEVICVEKPYVYALVSSKLLHCHTCLEFCFNPIPCDKCTFLLFCSANCKDQACTTFHKYECSALATLFGRGIFYSDLLAVRAAVLAKDDNSELIQDEIYRSDRYNEIKNLMVATDKIKLEKLYRLAVNAAFVFHVFANDTSIFNCPNNKIIKNQFKENVLLQMMVVDLNEIPIRETISSIFGWQQENFGHGLYSFASLLNHSCCPNVVPIQYGSTTVLKTINTIKEGQQCCITYGPTYWADNEFERFFILKHQYFFECKCVACVKGWRPSGDLLNYRVPLFSGMNDLNVLIMEMELNTRHPEAANKYLPYLTEQLKRYENLEPARNVLKIKQLIGTCYKIVSNRRLL